jgi:hypothetical protein
MQLPGEDGNGAAHAAGTGPPGARRLGGQDGPAGNGTDTELSRLWERLRSDLRELGASTWQVAKIYGLRASASVRKALFALVLGLIGAVLVLTLAIAAGVQVVAGLSGGLAELFGRAWAGQLAAGLLVLAAFALVAAVLWARASAKRVRKLRQLLAATSPPPGLPVERAGQEVAR